MEYQAAFSKYTNNLVLTFVSGKSVIVGKTHIKQTLMCAVIAK